MKIPDSLREFLVRGLCTTTSLKEAVKMVAVLEAFFAVGFICHGGYLYTTGVYDYNIFGILYLLCGFTYWTLSWFLWMTAEKPTISRCRIWIMVSILTQFAIIALMTTRNCIKREDEPIWSANIWILCGLFLQLYMISVVWAFMLHCQHPAMRQHLEAKLLSSGQASRNEKDKIISAEGDDNDNGKNLTVIAL